MASDLDSILDDISQIDFNNGYKKGVEDERARIKGILRIAWLDFMDDECVSKEEFAPINVFYDIIKAKIESQPSMPSVKSCDGCVHNTASQNPFCFVCYDFNQRRNK